MANDRQSAIMLAAATLMVGPDGGMEREHAIKTATRMADSVFGGDSADELQAARERVEEAQRDYNTLKRDAHAQSRNLLDLANVGVQVKAEAVARLIALGKTKTDAPKLLHEDEAFMAWDRENDEAKMEVSRTEMELSIARNELYTARLILASYLPSGDAAASASVPARD